MSTAPLPLCVIGAGLIGLRHVRTAQAHPDVTLTAVVEPNSETCATLRAAGVPAVADLDQVPRDTRAAIIATPTPTHTPVGLQALQRGWACLVEKPVAATLRDAKTLTQAASAAGLPIVIGHHRRSHPFVQAAKAQIRQLGDLVGVQGLWSLRKNASYFDVGWRQQPGSGPLLTNLSHEIDLLRLFCGEITEVSALASSAARGGPLEDTVALSFRFASGALGSFLLSDAGASPWAFEAATGENPHIGETGQDYLRLIGTKGALAFPSLTLWRNPTQAETEWGRALAPLPAAPFDKVDALATQLSRFVRHVSGHPDPGLATAEDGTATLAATLAAARSAETGAPVAPLDVTDDYPGWTTKQRSIA